MGVVTHNMSYSRLYRIHNLMKNRCSNPKHTHYKNYGGRGIKVCDEWMKFETFMEWALSNGYKDNLELDRIDNDKNYEPNNCQWITHKENNNKRGNNRIIELNGQAKTLSEWAEIYNISSNTIWSRLERGWETERAITTLPKNVGRRCWKTRQGCKSKRGGINDN